MLQGKGMMIVLSRRRGSKLKVVEEREGQGWLGKV